MENNVRKNKTIEQQKTKEKLLNMFREMAENPPEPEPEGRVGYDWEWESYCTEMRELEVALREQGVQL